MNAESVAPVGDPADPPLVAEVKRAQAVAAEGGTSYVVFKLAGAAKTFDGPTVTWEQVGSFAARDPESAIKAHLEKLDDAAGTFVAVAAKFWRPVTPAVEVVTTKTITLKAAS